MFRLCLIICCCTACTTDPVPTNCFHESTKAYSASVRSLNGYYYSNTVCTYLVQGSTFTVNRAPLLGIYPEGTEINYRPHIDLKTADGSIATWAPSGSDALAEDWYIIE